MRSYLRSLFNNSVAITALLLLPAAVLFVLAGAIHLESAQQAGRNALGMEFVQVPAGEFMMGCSPGDEQCEADERPRHRVVITQAFEIGRYEVTQSQWMALMGNNPSSNKGDARPVETVSKLEAQEFIAKLNAANDGYSYRLPTEAEWEYAARAGSEAPYSGALDEIAWYAANSENETHPVGQKKPNAWALYDVHGNVREWVSDFYSERYYAMSPTNDPTGPATSVFTGQPSLPAGGRPGRGGRGGASGEINYFPPPAGQPLTLRVHATQQDQIDGLWLQVELLEREVQQLRAAVRPGPRGAPPRQLQGGTLGPPVAGPAMEVSPGVLVDPIDGLPTGLPIVRGGGWDQSAKFQRVSARYSYYGPTLRLSDIGFRVVRVHASQ